ncbi:amino acid adenylation domain-containing protein [Streptosporangium sp. OZ121]|uniref:amino acid adenylation domain-containing protein n=1 Tax=Streptosporangium sp. OZ121 TaxID=3444183 RepID=UPI003F7A3790
MTAGQLIAELENLGVRLWEESGRLRFRAPQGVMTEERRAQLSAYRDDLLECLREPAGALTPEPADRHEPFPLTDVQAAYMLGRREAFDFGGTACQVYAELAFAELDPPRLEAAWQRLVGHHDMLRAVVHVDGHQRIQADVPAYRVRVTDLRGRPAREVDAHLEAVRAEMDHRVYDTGTWPLFELRVTQAGDRAVLHVSIDFLIADYLSIQLLLTQLKRLYLDPGHELPTLEIGFRDYLLAARRQRDGAAYERDRDYWEGRADDLPGPPELPVRENAATEAGRRFTRHQVTFDPTRWARLRTRAGAHGVTPSTAVLAAFAEVVGRWSRRPRFSLNLTLLNRQPLHPQVGELVGDFTTVSLLAVEGGRGTAFRDRARAIQDRLWEDLDHRLYSGVELMREIARRRGRGAALMPVVFTSTIGLSDEAAGHEGMSGLAEVVYGASQTPQVWIDCQAVVEGGALEVRWDVRDGVFPEGVVEGAFEALSGLLGELADTDEAWDATCPVELPAAQAREREKVNDTAAPLPPGLLHEPVVAQARRTPERPAVVSGGRTLTYGELLGRAEDVARVLASRGFGRGDLAAVMMEKGWEQVVAVLGTLLAGGAYLPVDTGQPPARRDRILTDAGVRHVLAQSRIGDRPEGAIDVDLLPGVPGPGGSGSFVPGPGDAGSGASGRNGVGSFVPGPGDAVSAASAPSATSAPSALSALSGPSGPNGAASAVDPGDLAYVIYTSGSTGAPKGVMISHRAALNTVADVNRRFAVTAEDRVLGLAGLGFDLSVYDIFGPLALGGTLVLPDAGSRGDPAHWARLIAEHGVTLWNSVPAQLQMLDHYLSSQPEPGLTSLRLALLSGDWIPVNLPGRVRGRLPGLELVSLGGATEAAIWSIHHPIGEVPEGWRSIPYGTPLANQTFHVLDEDMRPCPDHVPGELYIGGAGLALGYLGDEEKTAHRFVGHPVTGERLYRTGDLGRYHPGGTIEFLGREDRQVKIRGHRIELAEVEAAVQAHPAVAAADVLVEGTGLDRRLAAFVEPVRLERTPDDDDPVPEMTAAGSAAGDVHTRHIDRAELLEFFDRLDRAAVLGMMWALRRRGLFETAGRESTLEEILAVTGAAPRHHRLVRRWLRVLVDEGLLERESGRFRALRTAGADDLEQAWRRVGELRREDSYKAELIDYFRTSTEHLPELVRDEMDPLPLLFPEGRLEISEAAYRENIISRYVNHAAIAILTDIAGRHEGRLNVLEVGAGVGGTSAQMIPALAGFDVDYLFSDVSPFFLNEARERFGDRPWVRYGLFDINRDYREQGYTACSFDVILCANVLHNARHAGRVLARLREMLAPGGWLVFIDTTKDSYQIMTSMEFMMPEKDPRKWDYEDLRKGRDQTFLGREQWLELLTEAGADATLCLPGPGDATVTLGQSVFAARFKNDRARLDAPGLTRHLAERLPEYMIPGHVQVVDALPLTGNGKIDHDTLRSWLPRAVAGRAAAGGPPADDLERALATVWAEVLGLPEVTRDGDFFELGGDSLVIAKLAARLREEVPATRDVFWDDLVRQILHRPTVAALAEHLRRSHDEGEQGTRQAASPLVRLGDDGSEGGGESGEALRVLVHEGGGTLAPYRALARRLADKGGPLAGLAVTEVEPYLAEEPEGLIERRAARYARTLLDSGSTRFHVVGYCMGGLLATEVARHLTEAGADVETLTVISSYTLPRVIEDELVAEYVFARVMGVDPADAGYPGDEDVMSRVFELLLGENPERVPRGRVAELTGDPAVEAAAADFRRLAAVAPEERLAAIGRAATAAHSDREVERHVNSLFRVVKHSLDAVGRHVPQPYAGDITFLRQLGDTRFLPWLRDDMTGFWRDLCLGDLDVVDIPGDHFSCLQPPNVDQVADALARIQGER